MDRVEPDEGDPLGKLDTNKQAESQNLRRNSDRRGAIGRIKISQISHKRPSNITEVVLSPEEAVIEQRKRIVMTIIANNKTAECRKRRHSISYRDVSDEEKIQMIRRWHSMNLPWLPKELNYIIDELEELDSSDLKEIFLICTFGNF